MVPELVIFLITLYQRTLSPDHGPLRALFPYGVCRYEPSCSAYAKEAIARYGLIRGGIFAIHRMTRCHPWSPGGHDPAPGSKSQVPISESQTNSNDQNPKGLRHLNLGIVWHLVFGIWNFKR